MRLNFTTAARRALPAILVCLLAACTSIGTRSALTPLDDPAAVNWITARAVLLAGDPSLQVEVLSGAAIQAQQLPDNRLRIWTGLLLRTRDEAELTFVIAHELAHRDLGHFDQRADDPNWNAAMAEHQADLAARETLRQMGLRNDAGITLLAAIDAELSLAPKTDPQALAVIRERLQMLYEAGPAPAHEARDADPWRDLLNLRWDAWFAQDPAARDPERAAIIRAHVQR